MQKNRIALVIHRYGLEVNGGAERECKLLAEHLTDQYEVDVLTTCSMGIIPWDNQYEEGVHKENGVNVMRFKVECADEFPSGSIERIGPYSPQLIKYLKQNYSIYQGIILMTYNYYPTYAGLRLKLPNAIFLPTMHDGISARQELYKDIFKWPKAILYNSIEERQFIESYFKVTNLPSAVTCYGIDIGENKDEWQASREEKYIVYAGRISNSKNFNELNEYFLKYKEKNPSDLKLFVLGKIDNGMLIKHHDDIVFKGFVTEKEKNDYIKNAYLLVLPSKNESLSIVVLESFLHRRPVLVNGLCDVLRGQCVRSNAGLYYTNYEEFEAELNYLLSHEEECREMGNNGCDFVEKQYSWNKVIENVSFLINEINYKQSFGE
ncbi:hypothetical protein IMSAGC005_00066 [Lachnospiraceae bacterium]|nr:hypothetical protein IMSAGC005_00066 [Lachnospiraceae bacterium]